MDSPRFELRQSLLQGGQSSVMRVADRNRPALFAGLIGSLFQLREDRFARSSVVEESSAVSGADAVS